MYHAIYVLRTCQRLSKQLQILVLKYGVISKICQKTVLFQMGIDISENDHSVGVLNSLKLSQVSVI